jgi:hypothetical protein
MSEEFPGISKEAYLDSKDVLTYDMLTMMYSRMEEMSDRITALEKDFKANKKRDTVLTATMGLVGGAIAFFIQTAAFKRIV